ncbi:MAG: ATP-binding protein [Nocardioidaceae bacterium]
MPYRRRIIDDALDDLFPQLAAITIEGAKGVGKTATASQRASTILTLTDPEQSAVLAANLDHVVQVPTPVLIDEWQLESAVWDRVRRAVDDDNTGGQFLLAGSAGAAPGVRIHSGAGRIVQLQIRPMTLSERGLEEPQVSLGALLDGERPELRGRSDLDLGDYTDEILRSGFPGIRDLPQRARDVQLDSYVERIVDRDLPENGVTVRRHGALRDWLAAYAAATSTDASYTEILDAATPGEADKPARQTVAVYREQLRRIFVLDPVDAWTPTFSPLTRLTQTPKHHLVDPALAARLVGINRDGLLRGKGTPFRSGAETWLGRLFESLVTQSVRVYAAATNARVGHLRTKNTQHEIDLIVERNDRQCVAIEVKLGGTIHDNDVRHLNWLREQIGDRLVERLVVHTGKYAYRRPDCVAVVPLALLGP